MAEIKSTLDLVMERTKDLILSDDEKETQRELALKKRLAGLLQHYDDRSIKQSELYRQLDDIRCTSGSNTREKIVNHIIDGIKLNNDNEWRLGLLAEYFGLSTATMQQIIADHTVALENARTTRLHEILSELSRVHALSGSAIRPNIDIDPLWQSEIGAANARFQKAIQAEKERMVQQIDATDQT